MGISHENLHSNVRPASLSPLQFSNYNAKTGTKLQRQNIERKITPQKRQQEHNAFVLKRDISQQTSQSSPSDAHRRSLSASITSSDELNSTHSAKYSNKSLSISRGEQFGVVRPYRSHRNRACDSCRRRKTRCTVDIPGAPCLLCRMNNHDCLYLMETEKKKPKRKQEHTRADSIVSDSNSNELLDEERTIQFQENTSTNSLTDIYERHSSENNKLRNLPPLSSNIKSGYIDPLDPPLLRTTSPSELASKNNSSLANGISPASMTNSSTSKRSISLPAIQNTKKTKRSEFSNSEKHSVTNSSRSKDIMDVSSILISKEDEAPHIVGPSFANDTQMVEQYISPMGKIFSKSRNTNENDDPNKRDANNKKNKSYGMYFDDPSRPVLFHMVPRRRLGLHMDKMPGAKQLDILENITGPLEEEIINVYFKFVHPSLPILNKKQFLQIYQRDKKKLPPTLICEIVAMGLIYWYRSPILSKHPKPNQSYVWNLAVAALYTDFEGPRISSLISCIIDLAGRPIYSMIGNWMNCTRGVGLCQIMGLNKDPTSWNITTDEKAMRKKIWWGLVIHDKWISFCHGVPSHIFKEQSDVPIPTLEEVCPDDYISDENSLLPGQSLDGQCFIEMCKLTRILDNLLSVVFLAKPNVSTESFEILHLVDIQLEEWRENLPADLALENKFKVPLSFEKSSNLNKKKNNKQEKNQHNGQGDSWKDENSYCRIYKSDENYEPGKEGDYNSIHENNHKSNSEESQEIPQKRLITGIKSLHLSYYSVLLLLHRTVLQISELDDQNQDALRSNLTRCRDAASVIVHYFADFTESDFMDFWHPYTAYHLLFVVTILFRAAIESTSDEEAQFCVDAVKMLMRKLSVAVANDWDLGALCLAQGQRVLSQMSSSSETNDDEDFRKEDEATIPAFNREFYSQTEDSIVSSASQKNSMLATPPNMTRPGFSSSDTHRGPVKSYEQLLDPIDGPLGERLHADQNEHSTHARAHRRFSISRMGSFTHLTSHENIPSTTGIPSGNFGDQTKWKSGNIRPNHHHQLHTQLGANHIFGVHTGNSQSNELHHGNNLIDHQHDHSGTSTENSVSTHESSLSESPVSNLAEVGHYQNTMVRGQAATSANTASTVHAPGLLVADDMGDAMGLPGVDQLNFEDLLTTGFAEWDWM